MKELKFPDLKKVSGGTPFPWGRGGSDNTDGDDGDDTAYDHCMNAIDDHDVCQQYL